MYDFLLAGRRNDFAIDETRDDIQIIDMCKDELKIMCLIGLTEIIGAFSMLRLIWTYTAPTGYALGRLKGFW